MNKTGQFVLIKDRRGMALIITLALLLLMVGLIMAFFSKVILDRNIRAASAARDQTAVLARSAVGMIVADLLQEIASGSLVDPQPDAEIRYFPPIPADTEIAMLGSTITLTSFPSMAPQRVVSAEMQTSHPTLIKESRHGSPGFVIPSPAANSGYSTRPDLGAPPQRASAVSTTTGSGQTRGIRAEVWENISLGADTIPANAGPDWIYVDRTGQTPLFPGNTVGNAGDPASDAFVIGRFAYRIYDVGGLLNLSLLGTATTPLGNGNRSGLADLALNPPPDLPGMDPGASNLTALAAWRDADSAGSRAFLSRQDMLRTVARRGDAPASAMRWFTDSSYFAAWPAYLPNPKLISASPSALEADLLNPQVPGIRFSASTSLVRGTEDDFNVPSGTPVMPRKFPLRKLDLLAETNASAEDLDYFFGLQRQPDGSFRYVAADASGVIKDLTTVANEGREPNFFEVLQAVIATGSLGRNAGNTYTVDHERDGLRTRQTWQIGANIIDQWDSDDFPTTIGYLVPATGTWEPVHGVENLPYFNSVSVMGHRPEWDRNRFQLWAVFDVWNPHQSASTLPAGINAFRIVPRSGQTRTSLSYAIAGFGNLPTIVNGANQDSGNQSVVTLNSSRTLEFPSQNYGSPSLVGSAGPPDTEDWTGGLLLTDFENVPAAVPPNIETLVGDSTRTQLINSLNLYLSSAGLPRIGTPGGTFGAKAHNYFRVRSTPDDKVIIDLQYRRSSDNAWVTYQSIEGFLPRDSDPLPLTGGANGSSTVHDGRETAATLLTDTLISENSSNTNSNFYGWRFDSAGPGAPTDDQTRTGFTMVKYDPRTTRFGHNDLRRAQRGRTIRQSAAAIALPSDNISRDIFPDAMMLRTDGQPYIAGIQGFPAQSMFAIEPTNAMERLLGTFSNDNFTLPFGYIANIPEGQLSAATNPTRYRDRDGVIRPGDGYLGAVPTALPLSSGDSKGSMADRPLLLNRPFHSVAEMGYAFRDLPWKSLDFFSRNSGDLGLLDVFTLEPVDGETPVVQGKINLNSANAPVLAALLAGTARNSNGLNPISATDAMTLAEAIVQERNANGPFATVGDVVTRVFSPSEHNLNGAYNPSEHRKAEREAAIRTLAAFGDTRTWNLLVDLVVQSGRLSPTATSPAQFNARGERRYWVHLSLDRLTGELLHQRWEAVHD